ncbi:MAG: hypothetical protein ACK4Z6_05365 [Candidatus Methylomirabilales bacterium]
MEVAERQPVAVEISPAVYERLMVYCVVHGFVEREFVEQAIRERLEREEALEACFRRWETIGEENPIQ